MSSGADGSCSDVFAAQVIDLGNAVTIPIPVFSRDILSLPFVSIA
jgi:hypothetical protein